jgi:Core-2/I-Branching enzyme
MWLGRAMSGLRDTTHDVAPSAAGIDMKVGYLIVAHNHPQHFRRLLQAILTPQSAAFVHIDAKTDIAPFAQQQLALPNLHFAKHRVPVYWGEFTMVEAVLDLMRTALDEKPAYDYLVLISGSDYPIRPPAAFEDFLARNAGQQFINVVQMPNDEVSKPLTRLQHYKVLSGKASTIPLKIARRLLIKTRVLPRERSFTTALNGLLPYGGSTWWALTNGACRYILDFVEREREFVRFYRNTWFPDEGMIHTILGNSPHAASIRRNVTYTDWAKRGPHPGVIGSQHVQRFIAEPTLEADDRYGPGELFFARKFRDEDAALIDELDASFSHDARADDLLIQSGSSRNEAASKRPSI